MDYHPYYVIVTPIGSVEVFPKKHHDKISSFSISSDAKHKLRKLGNFTGIKASYHGDELWAVFQLEDEKAFMPHFEVEFRECCYKHTPHTKKCIHVDYPYE